MEKTAHRLRGRIEFDSESGRFPGATRIRLLKAVEKRGSISGAAP